MAKVAINICSISLTFGILKIPLPSTVQLSVYAIYQFININAQQSVGL